MLIIITVTIIIAALIFVVGPIIINEAYKKNEGYITVWSGEDALNYYGSAISAIGTIILGVIAWRQNTRLLKLEENNFVATNAVSASFTEVAVRGIGQMAVNLENLEEQILQTCNFDYDSYFSSGGSISFTCKLKSFDKSQHIAMVNVKKMQLICLDDQGRLDGCIVASNPDDQYTRVAITSEFDMFDLTVLLSNDDKRKLINALGSADCVMIIEMTASFLTDKYVATEMKCRATLKNPKYDEKTKAYTRFEVADKGLVTCFWYGASLKSEQEVTIKSISGGQS